MRRHSLGEEFFINVANETDEDDGVMVVVVVVGVMVWENLVPDLEETVPGSSGYSHSIFCYP